MTTPKARQPKGIRSGGQFAETNHSEAPVQLTEEEKRRQELERPLTVREVESLRNTHGTVEPHADYYLRMPKVFEAAAEKAANTDEGRLYLRQVAQSEELAHITGGPAREIRDFYNEIRDLEPLTQDWENKVQAWARVWSRTRGEVTFIDSKMRAVTGRISREKLVQQRAALTAQIDAMDVSDAAADVRRKLPTALRVAAEEVYNPDGVNLTVLDADGKSLWSGVAEDLPEMTASGRLDLIPTNYHHDRSPLRTSVEPQDEPWIRTYNLDRMAAVTAEDLLHAVAKSSYAREK